MLVVLEDDNGMYVSLSSHLSGLENWIAEGATVTRDDIHHAATYRLFLQRCP
jgi:hypothetical protein